MARPTNDELKAKIMAEAWRQFRDRGYSATSYTSIAKACGISRNLAQYHFPKKERLAIAFMEDLLTRCQQALGYHDGQVSGDYQRIYELGCCFFAHLLERGYDRFLLDIIESREMTESVIAFNGAWALQRTGETPVSDEAQQRIMRVVVIHMGGFYEWLYHCLRSGLPFDVPQELAPVMRAYVQALGVPPQQAEGMFQDMGRAKDALLIL